MTWKPVLFAALAMGCSAPVAAQDEIFPLTQPVALDPTDADNTEVGDLIYRGGVVIEPGEEEVGGISGLEWHDDRLYAVSDDGRWLTLTPDEIDGRLVDLVSITIAPLLDERGRRLRGKEEAHAESITRTVDGAWLVSFEQDHRVWRYETLKDRAMPVAIDLSGLVTSERANNGIEALESMALALVACGEFVSEDADNCLQAQPNEPFRFDISANVDGSSPVPTGVDCDSAGTCYFLLRNYTPGIGNHIAIVSRDAALDTKTIATLDPSLNIDNFEGIAVREQYGKTYLYIVSDNNFSDSQRTLLMKFEIKVDEPMVAEAPEPVVNYETIDVVLETELGDITIRLETERAPITAANFLRYVDEDRFDGTVFYRAMKLDREPQPNGLIQGGTQFDPDRILPGIPHEPTTETGLSHTNGALSMAMLEPGSANGDFSIMLQDQTGLDARPDAVEPIWQNGYAVFGYVIDGMDVVSAIHAAPADPDKGEGPMRGQILADPVEIIDARRLEPAE